MPEEFDYTKEARDFVTMNKHAVLSTTSVDKPGYPFGSIVPYDIDNQARIIIQVADISQHYKNLTADHRGSIIVTDQFGSHDPQAHARATVLAEFSKVPNDEFEEVGWSYKGRFPESLERERAHGFLYLRGVPTAVRWIGGFGEIGWISAQNFSDAAADPLAYIALDIIDHMNADHEEAMKTLISAKSDIDPKGKKVMMTNIRSTDFTLQAINGIGSERLTVDFPEPVGDASKARGALISMLGDAAKNG